MTDATAAMRQDRAQTLGEEIANSISPGLALLVALIVAPFLVVQGVNHGDAANVVGASVFAASMVLLYSMSMLLPRAAHGARAAGPLGLDVVWPGVSDGAGRYSGQVVCGHPLATAVHRVVPGDDLGCLDRHQTHVATHARLGTVLVGGRWSRVHVERGLFCAGRACEVDLIWSGICLWRRALPAMASRCFITLFEHASHLLSATKI